MGGIFFSFFFSPEDTENAVDHIISAWWLSWKWLVIAADCFLFFFMASVYFVCLHWTISFHTTGLREESRSLCSELARHPHCSTPADSSKLGLYSNPVRMLLFFFVPEVLAIKLNNIWKKKKKTEQAKSLGELNVTWLFFYNWTFLMFLWLLTEWLISLRLSWYF